MASPCKYTLVNEDNTSMQVKIAGSRRRKAGVIVANTTSHLLGESLEGCSSLLHHLPQLAHGASERARLCCIDGIQAHGWD